MTAEPAVNWDLLTELSTKAHPLITIWPNFGLQIREMNLSWVAEVFTEARTAHHLLDMIEIPQGPRDASRLDARTWLAAEKLIELEVRLTMIAEIHQQEIAGGGLVGSFCIECGLRWPCPSRKVADRTYPRLTEGDPS